MLEKLWAKTRKGVAHMTTLLAQYYIVKKFQVGGCNNGWTHHQAKPTYLRYMYLYLPST